MMFRGHKYQSTAVALMSACMLLFASGCGKKKSSPALLNNPEELRETLTGGFNVKGQAYTGFSNPQELKKLKLQMPQLDTKTNTELTNLIQWIKIQTLNSASEVVASIILHAPTGPRTVIQFKGPVRIEKDQYIAELKVVASIDNYSKELAPLSTIKLVSQEITFSNTQVFFLDSNKLPLAAALVKSETKTALLRNPKSEEGVETEALRTSAPAVAARKTKVDVDSMQVLNGVSSFRLRESANANEKILGSMTLGGEIIETDGQCNPIRTNNQNSKACLVGNSEDGGIVIKIVQSDLSVNVPPTPKPSEKPSSAFNKVTRIFKDSQLLTSGEQNFPAKPAPVLPGPKSVSAGQVLWLELPGETQHPTSEGSCSLQATSDHPLIQEIVAACKDSWWMKSDEFTRDRRWKCGKGMCKDPSVEHFFSYNGFLDYDKFIQMYETGAPGKVTGKNAKGESISGRDLAFSQMLQVLSKEGLHHILGIITYIESHFSPQGKSSSGAKGYWQFMPATAVTFGLSLGTAGDPQKPDQRTLIVPSTRAASRYLKYLLEMDQWKGNYKLSLAGYNWGEGNVRKKLKKIEESAEAGTSQEEEEETLSDVVEYSKDFWTLFEKKMLPYETRMYVLKFLYGSIIALSPQQYGLKAAPVKQ